MLDKIQNKNESILKVNKQTKDKTNKIIHKQFVFFNKNNEKPIIMAIKTHKETTALTNVGNAFIVSNEIFGFNLKSEVYFSLFNSKKIELIIKKIIAKKAKIFPITNIVFFCFVKSSFLTNFLF